jgi:hypothetical protein
MSRWARTIGDAVLLEFDQGGSVPTRTICRVEEKHDQTGRPLEVDPDAESADPSVPGFLARPEGAPVYHGFRLIEEVQVDGFRLGAISSFGSDVADGDAFIVAPDGSRAGLVWEVSAEHYLHEVRGFEEGRWGLWAVSFPHAIASTGDAQAVLDDLVPRLRPKWEAWRKSREQ